MQSTLPSFYMTLPNLKHPDSIPWRLNVKYLKKHVRQYASSVGLNVNDEENAHVYSYSTRVERVQKLPGSQNWTVTLRKLERVPGAEHKLRVDSWSEEFDAVVVAASVSETDSTFVPPISKLETWANTFPDRIFHSREYRHPEKFAGKNVLILGGSISGAGIATDLAPHAASVSISRRDGNTHTPLSGPASNTFPANATLLPEILAFTNNVSSLTSDVKDAQIRLSNGTEVSGYDYIILATGYRMSFPFLHDYHNSSIPRYEERATKIAPIITDGTHIRSLHWTGHYIPDPTLAFCTVEPWDQGPYQALALAKTWSGKARLPSIAQMWAEYPGAGKELDPLTVLGEVTSRLFFTWLNVQNLEFGGRLVKPLEIKDREAFDYYGRVIYQFDGLAREGFEARENMPQSEWPVRNGVIKHSQQKQAHWADVSYTW